MGGDHGPVVTVSAALSFLAAEENAELVLVGNEETIASELKKNRGRIRGDLEKRLRIVHASEVVTMDDPLEVALRRKKDSSMRVAIRLVKDGEAQACVSAGNTGALMAVSRYLLKTIPGVHRPAICAIIPNQRGCPTYMLDLGANVDCEPQHLHQFALMGSVLVSAMEGIARPTIGLLNVGEEDIKGNDCVKRTAALLRAEHQRGVLNFYGNVEGNNIFEGTTDIVVCDGFVGNVTLKASEGLGRFIKTVLATELKSSPLNMLGALLARGALKSISRRINPSRYNGASLLGLRGLVFKSHGSADKFGYEWAIRRAYDAANNDVLSRISQTIAALMPDADMPFEQAVSTAIVTEQKTA